MKNIKSLITGVIALSGIVVSMNAHAVPSFARQTNLACSACHNGNFLALNKFGRSFKLQGYVLSATKSIKKESSKDSNARLSLNGLPELSAMVQVSTTHNNTGTSGQQNNDVRLPQQLSLFLAGKISDKIGMFSQFTYANGESGFEIDNTDFRYADSTTVNDKSFNYGFTLDNNPTVGDLWNSTPAWGYPYSGSDVAAESSAGDFLSSLGGGVGGAGAYGMYNDHFYGKISLYRNTTANGAEGSDNIIQGVAPYWRLAYQTDFDNGYLMVGTYGITASVTPGAFATTTGIGGPRSKYTDSAIDFQYERYLSNDNSLVFHGSYTHEKRTDLDSDGAYLQGNDTTWNFSKLDAQYNLNGRWRPGFSFFNADTGVDNLDTTGYSVELSYFLWENVQLQAVYTGYSKFDGNSSNASDNNSTYLLFWVVL